MFLLDADGGATLLPEYSPKEAPRLAPGTDPDQQISSALGSISNEARTYCSAVALVSESRAQMVGHWDRASAQGRSPGKTIWSSWGFVGARSGVLAARNLQEAIISLGLAMGSNPMYATVDHGAIRIVKKELRERFPNLREVRDAVAHPEEYDRSKIDTTDGRFTSMQDFLNGDTYQSTFKGKMVTCSLSKDAALHVCDLVARLFTALEPISMR
jgi:hypothetical protein